MPAGQRHENWTREEAIENGRKGGIASGERRRMDREIRKIAEDILRKKCTDEQVIERLQQIGVLPPTKPNGKRPKCTLGTAVIAGLADICLYQGEDPQMTSNKIKAAHELLAIVNPPKDEKEETEDEGTGVVILPEVEKLDPPKDDDEQGLDSSR